MLTQITCSDCGVCCRVYVAFKPYFSCLRQLLLVEFGGSPQIPLNWLTLSTPLQNGTAIFTYNCGVLSKCRDQRYRMSATKSTTIWKCLLPLIEGVKSEKCSVFPLFPTLIYPRDPEHSATLSVTDGRAGADYHCKRILLPFTNCKWPHNSAASGEKW